MQNKARWAISSFVKNIPTPSYVVKKRKRYTTAEKLSLLYVVALIVLLLIVPVISIDTLSEEWIQKFSLFNAAMTKSYFLLLVSLLFLLAWNASYRFKNRLYETFGVTGSAKLINCGVLFLLLCILFVMGDTIALLTENFSASVWVTSGYLLLWVFLVWWIARQLVSARIQWKSHRSTNAISGTVWGREGLRSVKITFFYQEIDISIRIGTFLSEDILSETPNARTCTINSRIEKNERTKKEWVQSLSTEDCDYRLASSQNTKMILKAKHSNYYDDSKLITMGSHLKTYEWVTKLYRYL